MSNPAESKSAAVRKDNRPPNIDPLTGIRGLAALWVIFFHLRSVLLAFFPPLKHADGWLSSGYLGVDLFFVLSGFVLTYNYRSRFTEVRLRPFVRFAAMRLARIYPIHLLITLLCVAGVVLARQIGANFGSPPEHFTLRDLSLHLSLLHAWGYADERSWNFPSWSISAEWAAYLTFPFFCLVLNRLANPKLLLGLAAAAYGAMLWIVVAFYGSDLDLTMNGGLVRICGSFTAGGFLARWYQASPAKSRTGDYLALLAAGALLLVCGFKGPVPLWIVFLFGLLVLALAKAEGPFASFLASRFMMYSGRVSYAFYMIHGLIFLRVQANDYAHLGLLGKVFVVLAMIGSAWISAHLLHVWVEEPARERIRRWLR